MNPRFIFIAAACALLSGCVTLGFEATFEDLSLVREEPPDIVAQYSLPGREDPGRPLTGMLRLDFATDKDLIKLAVDDGYNTWFRVETCQSKIRIRGWSYIYENRNSAAPAKKGSHRHSIFLIPKWRNDYDLKQQPESICIYYGAGKMGGFFNYRSNTIEIDRDKIIAAFEDGQ